MTLKQALASLKKGGTAQNRKVYGRHGVSGEMFGVSYAEQKRLAKAAGCDHELAVGLWASGNHDARVLACLVADQASFSSRELDTMARELDNSVLTESLADVVDFYNNGGRVKDSDPLSGFLSGGIRSLDLSKSEKKDLVKFMEALTSPNLNQFTQR